MKKDNSMKVGYTMMAICAFVSASLEATKITSTAGDIVWMAIVGAGLGYALTALFFIIQSAYN